MIDDPTPEDATGPVTEPVTGPVGEPVTDGDAEASGRLLDDAARRAIAHELHVTHFVDAGAGSGKTSALVERVLELVTAPPDRGGVELEHVAAITFTEKAAAELRDRIRHRLEEVVRARGSTADRAAQALDQLDAAAIGTLHSFAQRILTEHPIEAGLPPHIEVLDEVESGLHFDARWRRFREQLYADPDLEVALVHGRKCRIGESQLRQLARIFNENWDLVATRVRTAVPDPDPAAAIASVLDAAPAIRRLRDTGPEGDSLTNRLDEICAWLDRLEAEFASGDLDECVDMLDGKPSCRVGKSGRRENWGGEEGVAAARATVSDLADRRDRALAAIGQECLERLAAELARFTLDGAEVRRAEGRLEFHDLLVMARELLRSDRGAQVRATLHGRYQRLLLDEFQDTDPIQIELAVLITADPAQPPGSVWSDLTPLPGRLFVVGDPKQSIYRFRRADIALFLDARQALVDAPLVLSTNFRTAAPVIAWVNHVFGRLIEFEAGSQPDYEPLTARPGRPACPQAPPMSPAVRVFGTVPHDPSARADEVRQHEADDTAAAVATAMAEKWQVLDAGTGTWRDPRLADITILAPTRTIMPFLERSLDALGIVYRAESSSLVYSTSEIRDLMLALRAIDDPTDQQALGATLRSSLFGCGDDDLYRFRAAGGRFDHQAAQSVPSGDPVRDALECLARFHERRVWDTPSEVLLGLIDERRVLEAGFAHGRARDLWRRVRFVVDQARAWSEAGGGSLRDYLEWARLQSDESARVSETILPETDDDAVRIMTVHAAKGLEFPITIVTGLTTKLAGQTRGVEVLWNAGNHAAVKVSRTTTGEFERFADIDERMGRHERLRLLYVACTRARDHLVVSLHRTERDDGSDKTMASSLATVCDDAPHQIRLEGGESPPPPPAPPPVPPPETDFDEWDRARRASLARASRPRTVSATAVATHATAAPNAAPSRSDRDDGALDGPTDAQVDDGLAKEPVDIDLPPWNKGRYGSAIGRAVHGALQTVDLTTGAGVAAAVEAQAIAEAVPQHRATIEALVRAALASTTVRTAAAGRHWREIFVAAPVGDRVLEGYVDLMYEDGDDLVVVDYKTDTVRSDAELAAKVDRYRLQAASYAVAVEAATDRRVARCVLLFLGAGGSRDVEVPGLAAATAEVRSRIGASV